MVILLVDTIAHHGAQTKAGHFVDNLNIFRSFSETTRVYRQLIIGLGFFRQFIIFVACEFKLF